MNPQLKRGRTKWSTSGDTSKSKQEETQVWRNSSNLNRISAHNLPSKPLSKSQSYSCLSYCCRPCYHHHSPLISGSSDCFLQLIRRRRYVFPAINSISYTRIVDSSILLDMNFLLKLLREFTSLLLVCRFSSSTGYVWSLNRHDLRTCSRRRNSLRTS